MDGEVPEPEAYMHFRSTHSDDSVLRDQWEALLRRAREQENVRPILPGAKPASEEVRALFGMCGRLEANSVIRFRALELYARFGSGCLEAGLAVQNCDDEQVLMWICTCILIAAKLHDDLDQKVLGAKEVMGALMDYGLYYADEEIFDAERYVMTKLDYRFLWVTPMDLIEQLLSLAALQSVDHQRAYQLCVLFVDFCYSCWEGIVSKWLARYPYRTLLFSTQAAGVVAAALFMLSVELGEGLHHRVPATAKLPQNDVYDFAILLLDVLLHEQ